MSKSPRQERGKLEVSGNVVKESSGLKGGGPGSVRVCLVVFTSAFETPGSRRCFWGGWSSSGMVGTNKAFLTFPIIFSPSGRAVGRCPEASGRCLASTRSRTHVSCGCGHNEKVGIGCERAASRSFASEFP